MKISIDSVDVEDWSVRHFCEYVRAEFAKKGIVYEIKYPGDPITMGTVFKSLRKQQKSKRHLKRAIDETFAAGEIKNVKDLSFIRTIALREDSSYYQKKLEQKQKEKQQTKLGGKPVKIAPPLSAETKEWLRKLRGTK